MTSCPALPVAVATDTVAKTELFSFTVCLIYIDSRSHQDQRIVKGRKIERYDRFFGGLLKYEKQ